MELTDKSEDRKLETILNAAQKMFGLYGLAKTTMNDIASEVGMGKASLYYYFPNKEKLYEAVVIKEQEHFIQEMTKSIKPKSSAINLLKVYSKRRMVLFETCLTLSKLSGEAISICVPFVKKLVEDFGKKEVEIIKSILDLGIQNEEFKQIDSLDQADFLVTLMMGLRTAAKNKLNHTTLTKEDYNTLNKNMSRAIEMFICTVQK